MWNEVRRLSLQNRLIVIAYVSRLLLLRGIGNMLDFQWLTVSEEWLSALGITQPVHIEEERAA